MFPFLSRRQVGLLVAALAAACGTSAVTAGTIRDDKVADPFYTSPTLDPSTGRINYASAHYTSGVLVARDWVLTALHCLTDDSNYTTYTAGDGVAYPIDRVTPYRPAPGGVDMALFHLLPSTATNQLPAAGTVATRYRGTTEAATAGNNNLATHVGYGYGGKGSSGVDETNFPQGVRRAGQNRIDLYARINGDNTATFTPDPVAGAAFPYVFEDYDQPNNAAASSSGSAVPETFEYMVAVGDSGGGIYIDVNGSPQLAAIHVSADPDGRALYGYSMYSLRVNQQNAWIDGVVPEPGSVGVLVVAAGILGLGRRRGTGRS